MSRQWPNVKRKKNKAKMRETYLEINRQRLLHNLEVLRGKVLSGTKILVNLKGNAYGTGALETGRFLEKIPVDYFSTAYINEAVYLRKNGITTPILVFNPSPEHFQELTAYQLEPEVSSLYYLKNLLQYLTQNHISGFPIHIKLDTGMHRAGIMPGELPELINLLKSQKTLRLQSVFSHLAAAEDPAEDVFTRGQINLFEQMTKQLQQELSAGFFRHLLNTAGIFRFPHAHYDMIRPGLGVFGYNLVEDAQQELQPIARLITKISQVKNLQKGETVGYNRNFTASDDATKVALLPLGYADGLNRLLGQGRYQVRCKNYRLPVIGNVSMDTISVDITGTDCAPGDEVIIFDNEQDVYQMAELLQTIPYEIITSITGRVPRVLV